MDTSHQGGLPSQGDDRIWAARPIFIYNAVFPERLGSVALHAFIPARQIGAKALYFGPETDPSSFLDRHAPKVIVITKALDQGPVNLAREAKRRNIRIICTFCDLHVAGEEGSKLHGSSRFGLINRELAGLADVVVASTKQVARFTEEHFERDCIVIEEPVEYPRQPPRFSPGSPLKLLWTGHPNNHDTLPDGLKALSQYRGTPLGLMIVSSAPPRLDVLQAIVPNIKLGFRPWSPLAQVEMLHNCDIVFVPSQDTPVKQAKGQARLVGALQAGRVAIVHPLPQYEELADYCYCSRDYVKSLEAILSNPAEAIRRVEAGQRHIDAYFSQEACGEKWRVVINSLL